MTPSEPPTSEPDIHMVLRPLRDPDGIPLPVRLRRALKTLLRRDRLRCIDIIHTTCTPSNERKR